jgi:archaellum component FlaC
MSDTTEIEKKSLEAHVELCAERYKFIENKLDSLEEKIITVVSSVSHVKSAVETMATKNNDRLVNWGLGIIVFLLSTCGWLIMNYILK